MATYTVTAADVGAVAQNNFYDAITAPAAEAITAGQYVRLDTNGKLALGNATTAAEARAGGIAIATAAAGITLTAVRKGYLDMGDIFTSAAYDADVYLSNTDGTLSTSAGTVSLVVGTVAPAWGSTTADKLLRVDL